MLINVVKRRLTSEIYLFASLFLLYSFSYYDFLVMLLPNLDSLLPGIQLEFEALVQTIYFMSCLTFAGIGLVLVPYGLIRIFKMARAPVNVKIWQFAAIAFPLLVLFILILQSSSLVNIGDYTAVISDNWVLGMLLFGISGTMMFLTLNLKFFPFLRNQARNLNINIRKDQFYAMLVNFAIALFAVGFAIRIYFGTTWENILVADLFLLASTIIALILGFFSGFGETLLCLRNMESIYIVHQSGKLIYTRRFFPESLFDEEFFGAFLLIINEITKEIRSKGGRISQIVLEDNSEIIQWKGDFIQGVLITKTYSPLFIKKLRDLVTNIERNVSSDLKNWTGERLELDQQIEGMLRELF